MRMPVIYTYALHLQVKVRVYNFVGYVQLYTSRTAIVV